MKIRLIQIGKTEEGYLETGIAQYRKRMDHYARTEEKTLPAKSGKNKTEEAQKKAEGEEILAQLQPGDKLILLDERGKQFSSQEFAAFLQKEANQSVKGLVFVIGGPFGFSDEVYKRADLLFSLSKMTFSHQMIRLFFWEQLYRAHTILKGEKYHHA